MGRVRAFLEYGAAEAPHWLAAAHRGRLPAAAAAAPRPYPINATVPAVAAAQVPEMLARFPGARTAKVKVAEPGRRWPTTSRGSTRCANWSTVRVDANGGWTVKQAARPRPH